jgi:hypothetical protein
MEHVWERYEMHTKLVENLKEKKNIFGRPEHICELP